MLAKFLVQTPGEAQQAPETQITPLTGTELNDGLKALNTRWPQYWQEIQHSVELDSLQVFAQELKAFSKTYRLKRLSHFSQVLKEHLYHFDFLEASEHLTHFLEALETERVLLLSQLEGLNPN